MLHFQRSSILTKVLCYKDFETLALSSSIKIENYKIKTIEFSAQKQTRKQHCHSFSQILEWKPICL